MLQFIYFPIFHVDRVSNINEEEERLSTYLGSQIFHSEITQSLIAHGCVCIVSVYIGTEGVMFCLVKEPLGENLADIVNSFD